MSLCYEDLWGFFPVLFQDPTRDLIEFDGGIIIISPRSG